MDQKTDKSITNLEFLAARAKSIPIYAFVDKSVLAVLPVWEDNPDADYSRAVDTSRLFEFLELVRNKEKVWTFPFEKAQDIIAVLRLQLAYLFNESLGLRNRLGMSGFPRHLASLGPRSLRIALEKPRGWEYRLFFQSWIDKIDSKADEIREYRAGLRLGVAESVAANESARWLLARLHELTGLVSAMNDLIKVEIQEAFGQPGQPGDTEKIVWVSSMLDRVFENALRWASRIRCACIESPFNNLGPELSLFVDDLVNQMIAFPRESLTELERALSVASVENPQTIHKIFTLTLSNTDRFHAALEEAKRLYLSGGY